MENATEKEQNKRICQSLRKIANTLEGNRNAEILAFFIKVVRTFADDNVFFFNEKAFGNEFVEWQIITKDVDKLYLQKTALDSSTQPVEIAKIPTNLRFSEMINFCSHMGLIDVLPSKFAAQSELCEYYFRAIVECSKIDQKQHVLFIHNDMEKCYDPFKCVAWKIFKVNGNPYIKKVRLDDMLHEKDTIQVSQMPSYFTLQELVQYCLFLGIVN